MRLFKSVSDSSRMNGNTGHLLSTLGSTQRCWAAHRHIQICARHRSPAPVQVFLPVTFLLNSSNQRVAFQSGSNKRCVSSSSSCSSSSSSSCSCVSVGACVNTPSTLEQKAGVYRRRTYSLLCWVCDVPFPLAFFFSCHTSASGRGPCWCTLPPPHLLVTLLYQIHFSPRGSGHLGPYWFSHGIHTECNQSDSAACVCVDGVYRCDAACPSMIAGDCVHIPFLRTDMSGVYI